MCGRFTYLGRAIILSKYYSLNPLQLRRFYNISPTQYRPVIAQDKGQAPEWRELYWGLIPSWSKDKTMGARLINARAEKVHEKPSFRDAFKRRRCLIPASGFYEWLTQGKVKTPYYFSPVKKDDELVFAGLWERWSRDGEDISSFTIITTEANATVAPIHDRMPVILGQDDWSTWLDPETRDTDKLLSLLRPADDGLLQSWQVSSYVSNSRNEGPECIERVA